MPSPIGVECHFFHGGEPPLVGVKRAREVLDALVDLAQMVAVITTIRIRQCVVVIVSSRSTYMCQAVRQPQRR